MPACAPMTPSPPDPAEHSTPRVGLVLTTWLDDVVLACTYLIVNAPAPAEVPESLLPSPPGSDDDESNNNFAAQYLQPSAGDEEFMGTRQDRSCRARDNDEVRGFAAL
eukprot:4334657-Pleurochrysis_carterae.AAC.2